MQAPDCHRFNLNSYQFRTRRFWIARNPYKEAPFLTAVVCYKDITSRWVWGKFGNTTRVTVEVVGGWVGRCTWVRCNGHYPQIGPECHKHTPINLSLHPPHDTDGSVLDMFPGSLQSTVSNYLILCVVGIYLFQWSQTWLSDTHPRCPPLSECWKVATVGFLKL